MPYSKRRTLNYRSRGRLRRANRRVAATNSQISDERHGHDSANTCTNNEMSENQSLQSRYDYPSLSDPNFMQLQQGFIQQLNKIHILVCSNCREQLFVKYNPRIPYCQRCRNSYPIKFTAANNMDPGPVPVELQGLTHVEQMLIAQVNPTMSIFRLPSGGQYGFSGHVLNLPQRVDSFVTDLPRTIHQIDILVLQRPGHNESLPERLFTVRRAKVHNALLWLKNHNMYYGNININAENLQQLPENSVIHFDNAHFRIDERALTNDHMPVSTVHDSCDRNLDNMPQSFAPVNLPNPTEQEAINAALSAMPNNEPLNWPVLDSEPINEFNTAGYLTRAFPCLFPTGAGDLRGPRQLSVSQSEYFKHMLNYFDGRFQSNPRFLYLAYNSCLRWQALQVGKIYVRNNPQSAPLTVQDLRGMLRHEQQVMACKILRFGSSLRGTPQYWYSQKANLMAMVKQIGKASIFFTFSVADTQWPDLQRHLNITEHNTLTAITNAPHTTDAYVTLRFETFFKTFLMPYLRITDYWYRYEWQSRGSLHVHGLAWLEDRPDTHTCCAQEIGLFTDRLVCAWNPGLQPSDDPLNTFRHIGSHPCSLDLQQVDDLSTDLKNLVTVCQRHTRCSPAYCLRNNDSGQQQCRFGFPKYLQPTTTVQFTVDDNGQRTKVDVKPARNDPLLNTYNPHCLSTWRANMDITIVLNLTDVANYIAKYASKAEQASHNYVNIFETIVDTQLTEEATFQRAVSALLLKTVGNQDVSAQQAAHITSGRPLLHSSREFVPCYINGYTISDELHAQQPSDIRKYMKRPSDLENLSLLKVLKSYTLKVVDGVVVCRVRSKDAVVKIMPRLPNCPSSPQYPQYCMQYLALHKPFRQWQELTDGFTSAGLAYQAFTNALDLENTDDELDNALERAIADVEEQSEATMEQVREHDPWMTIVSAVPSAPPVLPQQTAYDWSEASEQLQHLIRPSIDFIKAAKSRLVHTSIAADVSSLNTEQRQVFDYIVTYDTRNPSSTIVLGSAGTGKSYLIHCLRQHLNEACVIIAPTGVAALNIGGETVHSFFIFSNVNKVTPLRGESLLLLQQRCKTLKFVIVDEISMIGCRLLNVIDMRLRQAFPNKADQWYGGCSMIMFGDLGQLPPVCDSRLFQPNRNSQTSLQGHAAYRTCTKVFFLQSSVRQADDHTFRDTLLRLRDGLSTPDDYDLLTTRFAGVIEENSCMDAVRLYPTTAEVSTFNNAKLLSLNSPIAHIESVHNTPQATLASSCDASGLSRHCSICVGATVMLRANLWTKGGLVNGSIGKVLHIIYSPMQQPPALPAVVICEFPDYIGPPFLPHHPKSVPITPISRRWQGEDNTTIHQRTGLPLSLAWALTIHKCQGLTLNSAFVTIGDSEQAAGSSFVALSRVRHLDDLILSPFPFDRIATLGRHIHLQARLKEEDRLRSLNS